MTTKYTKKASPSIPQSSNSSPLTQLSRRAAYTEPGSGSTPHILFGAHHHHHPQNFHLYPHSLSHPLYHTNTLPFPPPEMHDSVLRNMEKQQIREEIIMSEIIRRRVLEEEVRRELAMERAMAFQRGGNIGTQFGSSSLSSIGLETPKRLLPFETGGGGQMSLEDKIIMSLDQKEKVLGGSSRVFGPSPFSRISEVKPLPEGSKEKGEISSLVNTNDENTTGLKRKTSSPVEPDNDALLSDVRKKVKGWFCDVCNISTTSERALNEHMEGKKHRSKEQRAGKNYRMGMFSKTTPNPKEDD